MRKPVLTIIIFMLNFGLSYAQKSIDSSNIVKILTFNIFHGETMNNDFDLDKIAKVIINAQPDIVALQEVDFNTNRVGNIDLITELGIRTKMIPLFAKAMSFDGGEYGEGILSKYSFLQTQNVALPYTKGNEPRTAIEIVTVLSSGDTIAFVGTHLDHLKDKTNRIMQVNKINKEFLTNRYPIILAGDLNAIPASNPIEILEKYWISCYDKNNPQFTFPSDIPNRKIDYVLYYPNDKWKVIKTKVICDKIASDHCAYLVTLELTD